MASSSNDPTTGAPVFLDADAPDAAVNPTQVAAFAAAVGTRLIGTTAERTAYTYAREGLRWYDTTLDAEYIYDGSGWTIWAKLLGAYSPTLANVTVGNGVLRARYEQHGSKVWGFVEFTLGSTSSVAGTIGVPLPSTPATSAIKHIGSGNLHDTSASADYPIDARYTGTGSVVLNLGGSSGSTLVAGSNVTNLVPMTLADGDWFYIAFSYEAA